MAKAVNTPMRIRFFGFVFLPPTLPSWGFCSKDQLVNEGDEQHSAEKDRTVIQFPIFSQIGTRILLLQKFHHGNVYFMTPAEKS